MIQTKGYAVQSPESNLAPWDFERRGIGPHDVQINNGIYIHVGMPAKPWEIPSFTLAMGNKVIAGSGAGGLPETQEMPDFCAANNIVADIELIDIKDVSPLDYRKFFN